MHRGTHHASKSTPFHIQPGTVRSRDGNIHLLRSKFSTDFLWGTAVNRKGNKATFLNAQVMHLNVWDMTQTNPQGVGEGGYARPNVIQPPGQGVINSYTEPDLACV